VEIFGLSPLIHGKKYVIHDPVNDDAVLLTDCWVVQKSKKLITEITIFRFSKCKMP